MVETLVPNESPQVIYSDDDILVVEKPAGLLSVADGYDASLPYLSTLLSPTWGTLWMVHRLDRDTSGLLVIARNALTHRRLNQQFRERQVTKIYHAVVAPCPDWTELSLDTPLRVNADREHRTRVDLTLGKPAKTSFRVLKTNGNVTLLECQILTGYRHQIRAHLYSAGLRILGDTLYGAVKLTIPAENERIMLHAAKLTFDHPTTGSALCFNSPDPLEFSAFI